MKAFFITPLVIFLLFVMVLMAKMLDTDKKMESHLIGKPMPSFDLPVPYDGLAGLTSKDVIGKYALVNVFAEWCLTCKIEHSFLMKIKEQGMLPIYGINWKDDPKQLQRWLEAKGNPYSKIGADEDGKVVVEFGVTGAPETFLISPEGIVLYSYAGVLNEAIFNKNILTRIKNQESGIKK